MVMIYEIDENMNKIMHVYFQLVFVSVRVFSCPMCAVKYHFDVNSQCLDYLTHADHFRYRTLVIRHCYLSDAC